MSFINDTLSSTRKLVHRPEAQPLSIPMERDMHDEAHAKMNTKGYRIFGKDIVTESVDSSGNREDTPSMSPEGGIMHEVLDEQAFPEEDDGYWTTEFDTTDRPQKYEECRASFDEITSTVFPPRGSGTSAKGDYMFDGSSTM